MTDERLAKLEQASIGTEFYYSVHVLAQEVKKLRTENAALVAERDRLRAGLEKARGYMVLSGRQLVDYILAGADVREPAQAEAVRQGTWRVERCPRCHSPSPELHPAVQHEGEVQECSHSWHKSANG